MLRRAAAITPYYRETWRVNRPKSTLKKCLMPAETLCTAAGQPLSGPLLFTPKVFGDDRGFLRELE